VTAIVQPPMTYFGGKTKLARRIAALLPRHEHYVEPFAGSLAILLAKAPSRLETVSDLDGDLIYLDIASHAVTRACPCQSLKPEPLPTPHSCGPVRRRDATLVGGPAPPLGL
jgi:hypothetical protein